MWHPWARVSRGRHQLEPQLGFSLRCRPGLRGNPGLRPLSRLTTAYGRSSAAGPVRPRPALLRERSGHRNRRRSEPNGPRDRASLPVGTGKSPAPHKPRGSQPHRSPRSRCRSCMKSLYHHQATQRKQAPTSTGNPRFNRSHLTRIVNYDWASGHVLP